MKQGTRSPFPDDDGTDREWGAPHRWIVLALVALDVALAAQVFYLLAGSFGFSVGGGSGLEMAVFFIGGALVLVWLVWVRRAVSRQRMRPATAFVVLGAAAFDLVVVSLLANGVLAGSCSEEELRVIRQTPTYPGVEMTFVYDRSDGTCVGSLGVHASADDVLGHYERELEADGWTVLIRDIPGQGRVVARDLRARRGDSFFTIALESWPSGETSAAITVDA